MVLCHEWRGEEADVIFSDTSHFCAEFRPRLPMIKLACVLSGA